MFTQDRSRSATRAAKRRILVVAHGYPPRQGNGGELHVQRKVRWWTKRGYVVRVIAADPVRVGCMPFGRHEVIIEDVEGVEVRRVRFAVADASRPFLETYRNPLLATFIDEQVAAFEPDLVYQVSGYLFGVTPIEAAARRNIPVALFVVDYWHQCARITLLRPDGQCCAGPRTPADCATCRIVSRRPFNVLGPRVNSGSWSVLSSAGSWTHRVAGFDPLHEEDFELRNTAIAEALKQVDLVIANSRFLVDRMRDLGVPENRVVAVRQGLDVRCQREPTTPHAGFNVLYLGQLSYHKGIDLLIDAVDRLAEDGHDIQLRAFGPYDVDWPIVGTSERIQIHGPISYAEIWEEVRRADVLVAPSRWYENSPNVILEAQAAGIPVVAADHGGMAEMVRHGVDGLLFRPGDAGSLGSALRLLMTDPELLAYFRSNAPTPHDIDTEMAVEEQALRELLHAAPATAS